MDSDGIDRLLRSRCCGQFVGVFAADRLPARLSSKRPLLLVCNTDRHDRAGRHWVVIYLGRDSSRGEYFDSLNQLPPTTFKNSLDRLCTLWITNGRQLQSAIINSGAPLFYVKLKF